MSKIYSVPNFEYGYIRKEEDMAKPLKSIQEWNAAI